MITTKLNNMRIAITGIGIISALGLGKEANKANLLAGRSGICAPRILQTIHKEWPVGEVGMTNEQLKQQCRQKADSPCPRNVLLAYAAASEAVADAHLTPEQVEDLILVNGTTVGGMDSTENEVGKWLKGNTDSIDSLIFHEAGATSFLLSHMLGGTAGQTTISTACSSALNAIMYGTDLLRMKASKRVLVGGTEALTRFHLNGFGSLGILSEQVCRPFHPDRDGINLGEGAAYLVLETEEEALARGASIYGYVSGYGNRCDAYHQTASSPTGTGAFLAMHKALLMAELKPADIEYLNAHGTATPNNDASEACAIERLFGTPFEGSRWPEPRSTKNLTGHTTSASGSIETIFCLMLMQERGYKHVMTNAFGFGGNDSSLILSAEPTNLPELSVAPEIEEFPVVSIDEDPDTKQYLSPMQARRMNSQMRRMVVAAKQALEQAGISVPDAIIVGTRWGGIVPTMELLKTLVTNGEYDFSPTLFMQSTHNTAASTLAMLLGCRGFNCTISEGVESFDYARSGAIVRLADPNVLNVLVCGYDEEDPDWQTWLARVDDSCPRMAKAFVIKKK